MDLRVLIGPASVEAVVADRVPSTSTAYGERPAPKVDLAELYAPPRLPWLRVNMVSTLDGSAQGADGLSGSINNEADHAVFTALREGADCLIVGAGTVRAEGYGLPTRADGTPLPIVVVTRSGSVPDQLTAGAEVADGRVLLATVEGAPGLDESRALLGEDQVLATSPSSSGGVKAAALKQWLIERGLVHQLSEGGPSLLNDFVAAGVVDELCLTWVPMMVGGDGARIAPGVPLSAGWSPYVLLEAGGTLLGRWFLIRSD